jgi:hypothetical protein
MTQHQTSRTLVKSAPELWAECSDAASLARHLGAFGEIRITKLQPETTVAWEGTAARGTVTLEPSGWGTRVTLTITEEEVPVAEPEAVVAEPELVVAEPELVVAEPERVVAEPERVVAEPEPAMTAPSEPDQAVAAEPDRPGEEVPPVRPGLFARLMLRFRGPGVTEAMGEPEKPGTDVEPEEPGAVAEPEEPVAHAEPPQPEPGREPETAPEAVQTPEASCAGEAALAAALDSLGRAHHRPYSRA